MTYFLQSFGDLSFATVIIFVAAICFFIELCSKLYNFIVKNHDLFQNKIQALDNISKELRELKEGQSEMKVQINKIQEKQVETETKQKELERENKEMALNRLRDKLLQSYRYYTDPRKNPDGAWTDMEKEAFYALFKDYEKLGGNGFMHTEVEPKMANLRVIPVSNNDGFEDLMKNRKG